MSEEWKNKRKRFYSSNFSSPKFVIGGIFGVIGVIILGGMMVHFFSQSSKKDQLFLTNQSIEAPEKNSSETKPIDETVSTSTRSVIYVDVKGAVKRPGMYTFVAEDRVFDVIQKAGGLTESADEKQINFAAKITDQQMLYVPEVGEEIPESSNASLATLDSVDTNPDRVHLNTADLSQLQQIPGIGEKKAREIIQYRQDNGSFKSIDELQEIDGIGQKTVEKIKNFVTITIE